MTFSLTSRVSELGRGRDKLVGLSRIQGRHISGSWTVGWNVALVPTIEVNGAVYTVSSQGHELAYNASTELVTQPFHVGFDSARVWDEHDGAEFVPAHVRIPVILYLGNST